MKQQQRMKIVKGLTKKIRSEGRMDAKSRWWATEVLAADCEKEWIHQDGKTPMQKWCEWLEKMKKEDEKKKMEEMHQQKGDANDEDCGGKCGTLAQITKPTAWRGGAQILKKAEEDARLLDRCEAKRKELAKYWQYDEDVENLKDKPWKNEELRSAEEALSRLKEYELENVSRL